ncbi:hypothetical protein IQ07DRAFT_402149 [Pyrenochaeta sp. DS3sAY3a]|nr:hypothetical protein IQ07DRAFT_402149 [Pyrenochaeta sp. DS3sAY3a]
MSLIQSYSWLSTACRWPVLWPMASEAPENRGSLTRYGHLIGCALKHVPDCFGATPTSPQVTYHSNFKTPSNTSKLQAPAIMLGQCCLAVNSHVKPCSMAANAASKPGRSPSSNGSPLSPSERLDCRLPETNGFLLSFPCCLSFLFIFNVDRSSHNHSVPSPSCSLSLSLCHCFPSRVQVRVSLRLFRRVPFLLISTPS